MYEFDWVVLIFLRNVLLRFKTTKYNINMSSEISKEEWRKFVEIASAVLEAHPDKNYTKTVASALDDEVLIKYQVRWFQFTRSETV